MQIPICDRFVGHRVKHRLDDTLGKSALLIVVHRHDLFPVRGNFTQAEVLAQIDQVQNVFLETRATEADTRLSRT